MSAESVAPATVRGDRVEVRPPSAADESAYTAAVTRSAARLSEFAVPDPHNLPAVIANQSPTYRTFMVHALDPEGDHGLVGRANVGNVVRGAFQSASIGYDAYDVGGLSEGGAAPPVTVRRTSGRAGRGRSR